MFNELIEPHWGVSTHAQPIPSAAGASRQDTSAAPKIENASLPVVADATLAVVEAELETSSCAVSGVSEATQAVQDGAPETSESALEVAEAVCDAHPDKLGVYWPDIGISQGDYEPSRLIPALEQWVTSSDTWTGAGRFLKAARIGQAREFIEDRRRSGITSFAARLSKGERSALRDAGAAGFDVSAWDTCARLAALAHTILPPVSIPAHCGSGRDRGAGQ